MFEAVVTNYVKNEDHQYISHTQVQPNHIQGIHAAKISIIQTKCKLTYPNEKNQHFCIVAINWVEEMSWIVLSCIKVTFTAAQRFTMPHLVSIALYQLGNVNILICIQWKERITALAGHTCRIGAVNLLMPEFTMLNTLLIVPVRILNCKCYV